MKTGALIIASQNLDYQHKGNEDIPTFLPMLHVEGTTVIKREIATLRKAGVTPIFVLGGYQKEVLKNHLSHNGVVFLEDDDYDRHSNEETVQVGVRLAGEACSRFLIIPVQFPTFSINTIQLLMEQKNNTVPYYEGKQGFPVLYTTGVTGEEKTKNEFIAKQMDTEDEGILYALTDEGGYEKICAYAAKVRNSNDLSMKIKISLAKNEDFFGPGTYQLLKLIDEMGSIQSAAAEMGMSYTKGWKMINKAEQEMGFPFLKRVNGGKNGGSSTLTEEGCLFLKKYSAMVEDMRKMAQSFFDLYFQDFQ